MSVSKRSLLVSTVRYPTDAPISSVTLSPMGEIVPFPIPTPSPTCGWLEDVPVHIWPASAQIGDPCPCGAAILTVDPATLDDELLMAR
jgi:hypothetical protein